ncbi:MAG TPA: histidine kinase dimerization/phospho-acceptor domain-containing protein [bacterium]|jgi:two-component system sensor histidine kinase PilS (NtrC family)
MRITFGTRENFSTFLAARLVFATVLLGVGGLFRTEADSAWPYWGLFFANTTLSLGCWEWFHRRPPAKAQSWFALTGAVVLDTLILRYTGGARSEFVFLYFFSIGSAGLLTGLPGSLWTAALSSAGIVWLYYGLSTQFMAEHSLNAFIYAVNFLLTAVLSSYVFEKLRDRERTHQRTLGELERTRLDTQAILDSLGTGVVVLDSEDKTLYVNPASLSVLGLDATTSAPDVEPVFAADVPVGKAYRDCCLQLDDGGKAEEELLLPASKKPVGISVSALMTADGQRRGHIVLLSDLSRMKEAERLERDRERLADIGKLSQDLAHEIRNPLATVRGCVEVIKLSEKEPGEMSPYLELALRESDRLNGLLRDFLVFSHMEPPRKQKGDLRAFVQARMHDAGPGIVARDMLGRDLPAEFDGDQLTLVVETVLLTLAEWAEGKGEIRIEEGELRGRSVRFTLCDKSITAAAREAAFRPFSESHRLSNGLALPTAMRAVHAHGGKLTLHSEPGVGTWFELAI